MSDINEIKKNLKTGKIVFGTSQTLKLLKSAKLSKVFVASNCDPAVKEDIRRYSALAKTPVVELSIPNDELGVVCKKQFAVSVLSLKQ